MSTALSLRNEPDNLPSQEIAHAIAGTMEQLRAVRTFIKAEFQIGYKDKQGNIIKGVDAGLIPGCGDKPTLFLPGAQKATMYFNCFPTYKVQERDLGNGHATFRVRCLLISRATREQVGEGVGCCSTMEKKYRWRGNSILCPTCGKPAIFKSKDKPEFYCWKKKEGCGATFALNNPAIKSQGDGTPVENPDLYDVHNTVLKMAKKRAHVDAAMTLGCLSELFTQDIEDTYAADQVREAAQPYDGEVVEEHRPSGQPKPQNKGLSTKEALERTQEFLKYLREECDVFQARWVEMWKKRFERALDDGKSVPGKLPELINSFQAKNHLLKWAKQTDRLRPNVDPAESRSREAEAYLAEIFYGDDDDQLAVIKELGQYISKNMKELTAQIYRQHPELTPGGYSEELAESEAKDRGDAYEDDALDALDALDSLDRGIREEAGGEDQ